MVTKRENEDEPILRLHTKFENVRSMHAHASPKRGWFYSTNGTVCDARHVASNDKSIADTSKLALVFFGMLSIVIEVIWHVIFGIELVWQ